MDKINVLHLIMALSAGGAETNLFNLTRVMNGCYRLHVGYAYGGELEGRFIRSGVRLWKYSEKTDPIRSLQSLRIVLKLSRYILKNDIRIVHSHSYTTVFWAGLACWLTARKHVEHVHDSRYEPEVYSRAAGLTKTVSYYDWAKVFSKLSHKIIVLTKNNYDYVLSNRITSKENLRLLPNGIPLEASDRPFETEQIRKRLGLFGDSKIIFTALRLSPEKNCGLMIELAEKISNRCPEVLFLIAGEGPWKDRINQRIVERRLQNRIKLLGYQPDVRQWLSISKLFLLPSRWELHSLAMMEAMDMGVPALVSAGVGCNDSFITDGENGLLLDPLDAGQWAAAVLLLLNDEVLAQRIGRAGQRLVRETCDIRNVSKEIENIYDELIPVRS